MKKKIESKHKGEVRETYRFLVPFLGKVEEVTVNYEEHIDDDEEVVGVPESVETSELLDGFGEV